MVHSNDGIKTEASINFDIDTLEPLRRDNTGWF